MPLDTRRLPIPEESKSALEYATKTESSTLLNHEGKRSDGRKPEQLRPVFIRPGTITQAKGSAYMELNQTKVICAVYGPREVIRRSEFSMRGQLHCELKLATFSTVRRQQHQASSEEKEISRIIQEALEPAVQLDKFPKARMDIFITVLQHDGSFLAAALSCASVALADAGVEMYDLVVGCSLRQSNDLQLMDPNADEEYALHKSSKSSKNEGSIVLGYMPSLDQVSCLMQQGELDIQTVNKGIKSLVEVCQRLYPVLQQCLVKSVKQKLDNLQI